MTKTRCTGASVDVHLRVRVMVEPSGEIYFEHLNTYVDPPMLVSGDKKQWAVLSPPDASNGLAMHAKTQQVGKDLERAVRLAVIEYKQSKEKP